MPLSIAAFQLVGYSAWNGEDAGSSPACYTKSVRLTGQDARFSFLKYGFKSRTDRKLLDGAMAAYQNLNLKMLVRIQLHYHLLALAYLVKHHIVTVENRVRSPESTMKAYSSMDENTSLRMKRYGFESC
jgi:hypothetical protein